MKLIYKNQAIIYESKTICQHTRVPLTNRTRRIKRGNYQKQHEVKNLIELIRAIKKFLVIHDFCSDPIYFLRASLLFLYLSLIQLNPTVAPTLIFPAATLDFSKPTEATVLVFPKPAEATSLVFPNVWPTLSDSVGGAPPSRVGLPAASVLPPQGLPSYAMDASFFSRGEFTELGFGFGGGWFWKERF